MINGRYFGWKQLEYLLDLNNSTFSASADEGVVKPAPMCIFHLALISGVD